MILKVQFQNVQTTFWEFPVNCVFTWGTTIAVFHEKARIFMKPFAQCKSL